MTGLLATASGEDVVLVPAPEENLHRPAITANTRSA
jgi:hypothetical protein